MLLATILLSTAAALAVLRFTWRTAGPSRGSMSHLTYVALLFAVSYPLRAALISSGAVSTQVIGQWSDRTLAVGLLIATAFLLTILWGAASVRRRVDFPADGAEADDHATGPSQRVLWWSAISAIVSLTASLALSVEGGAFQVFQQNSMLERRVGAGVTFLLAEAATFGFVLLLASALISRQLRRPVWVASIVALHGAVAVALGVALSTRRPVATVLFGAAVWAIARLRPLRSAPVVLLLLIGTVAGAPALDAIRYSCLPCLLGLQTEVQTVEPTASAPALAEVEAKLAALLEQHAGVDVADAGAQRDANRLRERWEAHAAFVFPDQSATERRKMLVDELTAATATAGSLSTGQRHLLAIVAREDEPPSVSLTLLSSSFEGVDHVGTLIERASPRQLLTGVDHGEAWLYNVALSLVPRQLWSGKPVVYGSVAEQRFLYPYMFEETDTPTTLPAGFVVDLSYGFGLLVGLGLAFVLGRVLYVLWVGLWQPRPRPGVAALSLYSFLFAFNIVRGGTAFLQSIALLLGAMLVFYGRGEVARTLLVVGRTIGGLDGGLAADDTASSTPSRVYFYPHAYLRDRQLDVIARWPREAAVNAEEFAGRRGRQVSRVAAMSGPRRAWKQWLPLPNVKPRPRSAPADAAVYAWGALIATGPFIVDIDNPYALVGYNLPAMRIWRPLIRRMLLSPRCIEIRCISHACRRTLRAELGDRVADAATVVPPCLPLPTPPSVAVDGAPRLVFIGTQFELKGGVPLLRSFAEVRRRVPGVSLDMITHLPPAFAELAAQPGVTVHEPAFTRDQIRERFLDRADVLVHPTFVESFGMVVLEALSRGLAIVSTNVYALPEMVTDGRNGIVLEAPASIWTADGLPTPLYRRLGQATTLLRRLDTRRFEQELADALVRIAQDPAGLRAARSASWQLFLDRYACP